MVDYHLDLYPSDDPRDGAALVRFSADTALQSADYRDVIGVGAGQFLLRATRPEAAFLEPAGEQYVRVVEDTGTERVVGGFWTNEIRYGAALAKETKPLTVGGAGVMAYLARAVMAPHSYIHEAAGVFVGQDPFGQQWRLYAQGPAAGGDFLGAVLWRVIFEAQHFRTGTTPYTHKHADGLIYTDIHDNDRRRSAIPDLTLGFDQFEDSDGNAWTMPSGSFTAQVGENVLQVVRRLMEAGLYVEMDPDTFELRAWEGSDHRRDRTGGAWGAAVVRLQAPTDATIATGNVKSDSERLITSHVRRTTIWAGGGEDVYGFADTPTGTPWEGFAPSDMADVDALDNLADIQLTAREESGDVLTARLKLGDAPSDGRYLPWDHVKLDDLVTVHTGTDDWDYNEATYPVAALRIHLREGGDWDAWVDLGASFEAMAQRQFEVSATPAHTHPPSPELCRPPSYVQPTVEDSAYSLSFGVGISPFTVDAGLPAPALFVVTYQWPNDTSPGSPVRWTVGGNDYDFDLIDSEYAGGVGLALYQLLDPVPGTGSLSADSQHFGVWLLPDVDASTPIAGYAFATGTGALTAVSVARPPGSLVLNAAASFTNDAAAITDPVASGVMATDWADSWEQGGPSFGEGHFAGGHGDDSPGWTLTSSRPWAAVAFAVYATGASSGTGGDLPQPVGANDEAAVGTSIRAARCDHVHAHGDLSDHDDEIHHHADSIEGLVPGLTEEEINALIAAALATLEASDLATRWSPVTTWNGDHWIIVTDGDGTPVLTEVS